MKLFVAIVSVAALVWGCKKYDTDCLCAVTPYVESEKGGSKEPTSKAVFYGFYADTTDWTVASYEDALNGVITSRRDGQKRNYDMGWADPGHGTVTMRFTSAPAMLVTAYRPSRIYGWRGVDVVPGLPRLSLSVTFQPYLSDTTYLQGGWYLTNDYAPEPSEPGGDVSSPAAGDGGPELKP